MSEEVRLSNNMPTDRTKYYDASQFGMGRGTIIPAGMGDDKDGRSKGHNHNKPLRVIVDPDKAGSFELDMSKLNDRAIKKALANTDDLSERLLVIKNEIEGKRKEEEAPVTQNEKPVKQSSFEADNVFAPSVTMPTPTVKLTPTPPAWSLGVPMPEQTSFAYNPNVSYQTSNLHGFTIHGNDGQHTLRVAPRQPSDFELQLHQQLNDLKSNYDQLYIGYQEKVNAYTELVGHYEMLKSNYIELGDAYERASTELKSYKNAEHKPLPTEVERVLSVLPFLDNIPKPPKSKVVFNFKQIGIMSALYHKLITTDSNVVLIYDTRFEYGTQYMPPQLADNQTIDITILDEDGSRNAVVSSLGVNFSIGCLDISVLFKA